MTLVKAEVPYWTDCSSPFRVIPSDQQIKSQLSNIIMIQNWKQNYPQQGSVWHEENTFGKDFPSIIKLPLVSVALNSPDKNIYDNDIDISIGVDIDIDIRIDVYTDIDIVVRCGVLHNPLVGRLSIFKRVWGDSKWHQEGLFISIFIYFLFHCWMWQISTEQMCRSNVFAWAQIKKK